MSCFAPCMDPTLHCALCPTSSIIYTYDDALELTAADMLKHDNVQLITARAYDLCLPFS